MLHNVAKNSYESVILVPMYNFSSNLLGTYVFSDLWSPVSGQVMLEWVDWFGNHMNEAIEVGSATFLRSNDTSTSSGPSLTLRSML